MRWRHLSALDSPATTPHSERVISPLQTATMSAKHQRDDIETRHHERVPEAAEMFDTDGKEVPVADAVFGEMTEDGPNYRSVRVPRSHHNLSMYFPSLTYARSSFTA